MNHILHYMYKIFIVNFSCTRFSSKFNSNDVKSKKNCKLIPSLIFSVLKALMLEKLQHVLLDQLLTQLSFLVYKTLYDIV